MNGAQILVKQLQKYGVKAIFGYGGGAILPVMNELHNAKIPIYINTHEQHCGHSATGYARISQTTGILVVTSGPAVTNIITSMADAMYDSVPIVAITGQVPLKMMNIGAFQEVPSTEMTKYITKWSYCIQNVNEIQDAIDLGFKIATNRRKGVVHLDVPKCVLVDSNTSEQSNAFKDIKRNMEKNLSEVYNEDINITLNEVQMILKRAEKPVIIVGQGCNAYSELVRKLVDKNNIPIATTLHGLGIFDERDKLSLYMCGMHGSYVANHAIQKADCILGIGYRFDDRTIGLMSEYAPECKRAFKEKRGGIINCNIEQKDMIKTIHAHYNIVSDAKDVLEYLLKQDIGNVHRDKWIEHLTNIKTVNKFYYELTDKLKVQEIIQEIDLYIRDESQDTIIVTSVGQHQMYTAQFIHHYKPNRFITSGSLGTMTASLGYAIGCQIAQPKSRVIVICGDASLMMQLTELKTIAEYKLPIKIFVMNDGKQTMVQKWEQLFYHKDHIVTNSNHNPKFHKIALEFGIHSTECKDKHKMRIKVNKMMTSKRAMLCNCHVESDFCFPFVPPGKSLSETVRSYNEFKKLNNTNTSAPS
jgi:acetolactate synthase-1/2/3 large subunit